MAFWSIWSPVKKNWLDPPYRKDTCLISAYPHPRGKARPVGVGIPAKLKEQTISWIPELGGIVKTEEPPVLLLNSWIYFEFWVVGKHCFLEVSPS
jgi:hypothetical protein